MSVAVFTPPALRLNLGCWVNFKRVGWVNIDLNPAYDPDLVADALHLPYSENQVDEIYAGHLLEHMVDGIFTLLEWKRVLRPGGSLLVVVPDIERAVTLYRDRQLGREFLNSVAFGGADDRAMLQMHQRIYTQDILLEEMRLAGFRDLEIVAPPDPRIAVPDALWQVGVKGTK